MLMIGMINIAKMAILQKAIYRFNAMSIRIPMQFFTEIEKITLNFTGKHKKTRISKTILKNKKIARIITISILSYVTELQ